jgi:hypothetical protein
MGAVTRFRSAIRRHSEPGRNVRPGFSFAARNEAFRITTGRIIEDRNITQKKSGGKRPSSNFPVHNLPV